jgi:hypothetical protein
MVTETWHRRASEPTRATRPDPSFGPFVLEASLASIFICGIESSLIEALPRRSLHGGGIFSWNRWAGAATRALSAVVFIEVLLQPGSGFVIQNSHASPMVIAAVAAFATFTAASGAYVLFRPEPEAADV